MIQPVSVDETVVCYYPTMLKGAPEEMNQRRLSRDLSDSRAGGPRRARRYRGVRAQPGGLSRAVNEWLVLRRGLHREEREGDGTIAGHETDETTQRGIWRHYREVMRS